MLAAERESMLAFARQIAREEIIKEIKTGELSKVVAAEMADKQDAEAKPAKANREKAIKG